MHLESTQGFHNGLNQLLQTLGKFRPTFPLSGSEPSQLWSCAYLIRSHTTGSPLWLRSIASFKKSAMERVGKTTIFGPRSQHAQKVRREKKEKRERRRRRHVISCKLFSQRCIAARVKWDFFILSQKLWAWRGNFPMKFCGLCYAGSKTLWVLMVIEIFEDISACLQDTLTGVSLSRQLQVASQQMDNFHWLHICLGKNQDLGSWFLPQTGTCVSLWWCFQQHICLILSMSSAWILLIWKNEPEQTAQFGNVS